MVRRRGFKSFFPFLYALATSKEAWVLEVWDALGEDGA